MMIPAGVSELYKAFNSHSRASAGGDTASHLLLLFYAIECGLKSVYLRRLKLRTTGQITDPWLIGSHDLARWVRELKLSAQIASVNTGFTLPRDNTRHPIELSHQAWRYGIEMAISDEQTLVNWLTSVKKWIYEA